MESWNVGYFHNIAKAPNKLQPENSAYNGEGYLKPWIK